MVQAKLEGVDDALDDGRDVARHLPQRATGDAAAARLVSRELRPIGEKHARTAPGEMDRGRRSRRPGADDEDVDVAARHGTHVSDSGQRRTIFAVGAPVKTSGLEIRIRTDEALFE